MVDNLVIALIVLAGVVLIIFLLCMVYVMKSLHERTDKKAMQFHSHASLDEEISVPTEKDPLISTKIRNGEHEEIPNPLLQHPKTSQHTANKNPQIVIEPPAQKDPKSSPLNNKNEPKEKQTVSPAPKPGPVTQTQQPQPQKPQIQTQPQKQPQNQTQPQIQPQTQTSPSSNKSLPPAVLEKKKIDEPSPDIKISIPDSMEAPIKKGSKPDNSKDANEAKNTIPIITTDETKSDDIKKGSSKPILTPGHHLNVPPAYPPGSPGNRDSFSEDAVSMEEMQQQKKPKFTAEEEDEDDDEFIRPPSPIEESALKKPIDSESTKESPLNIPTIDPIPLSPPSESAETPLNVATDPIPQSNLINSTDEEYEPVDSPPEKVTPPKDQEEDEI